VRGFASPEAIGFVSGDALIGIRGLLKRVAQ
jgi:hypothetical protein